MIEKGTDFRKSFDFIRSVRKARIQELLIPYVMYAAQRNLEVSVDNYNQWMKGNVKCETYKSVHSIEKYFGTSLLMYLSAMRANNYSIIRVSKRIFSSLFHVNNHPNYAQIDVWTDYQDEKMISKNPEIYEYLSERRFTNKTGQEYRFEPHDERHEEYNKAGLNFQNNRSTESFATSFAVIKSYQKLEMSVLKEYDLNTKSNNSSQIQDYDDNIFKMRMMMRSNNYLDSPEEESDPRALNGKHLSESIIGIKEVADRIKQENISRIIQNNDFFVSLNKKKLDVLEQESELEVDFEDQVKILISSEENPEFRSNLYDYWINAKKGKHFSNKDFLNDLLENNYTFL